MKLYGVLVVLAACGDDGGNHNQIADAALHDSAIDAPLDTPSDAVAVKARSAVAGITVYFQNADSSLVATRMTDATGTASAVMAAGGYVTTVEKFIDDEDGPGDHFYLHTWAGVKPGDVLLFDTNTASTAPQPTMRTLSLKVPTSTITPQYYLIELSCDGVYTSNTIQQQAEIDGTVTTQCDPAKTDMFVGHYTSNGGTFVDSLTVSAQTFTDGGTLDLTGGTYAPAIQQAITIADAPTGLMNSLAYLQGPTLTDELYLFNAGAPLTNGTSTFPMAVTPTGWHNAIEVDHYPAFSRQASVEWGTTGDYNRTWTDLATPAYTSQIAYDTGKVSWTASTGLSPQGYAVGGAAARTGYDWNWLIVAAGDDSNSITLPTLPTDIDDFTLASGDPIFNGSMLRFPGGYDAIRPFFALQLTPSAPQPSISMTGKLAFTLYQAPMDVTRRATKHAVINR